ncbi:hypothetical protein FI667_g869, partial [Globisporangium splendens]
MEHEDKKEDSDQDVAAINEDDADSKEDEQEKDEADNARTSDYIFEVGSKLLHSADGVGENLLHTANGILGSLEFGNPESTDDEDVNDDALSARLIWLLALQEDGDMYLEPPMDPETFAKWKTATQIDELETAKAEVLEHYPAVVEKFTELVPSAIDTETFWMPCIHKASLLAV